MWHVRDPHLWKGIAVVTLDFSLGKPKFCWEKHRVSGSAFLGVLFWSQQSEASKKGKYFGDLS